MSGRLQGGEGNPFFQYTGVVVSIPAWLRAEPLPCGNVHCSALGQHGHATLRCGRCHLVPYCSKACQQAAWHRSNGKGHRDECMPGVWTPALAVDYLLSRGRPSMPTADALRIRQLLRAGSHVPLVHIAGTHVETETRPDGQTVIVGWPWHDLPVQGFAFGAGEVSRCLAHIASTAGRPAALSTLRWLHSAGLLPDNDKPQWVPKYSRWTRFVAACLLPDGFGKSGETIDTYSRCAQPYEDQVFGDGVWIWTLSPSSDEWSMEACRELLDCV